MSELVHYDTMCRAIAAAYEVDEVKELRDKAMALEHYSRQARNTEAERQACEIRLRAERRAGELLAQAERVQGQSSDLHCPACDTSAQAEPKSFSRQIADKGISRIQAQRWQQLAVVPEAEFEAALAAPTKPSTSGIITAAAAPKPAVEPMDEQALWLWGRMRDFERDGLLGRAAELLPVPNWRDRLLKHHPLPAS